MIYINAPIGMGKTSLAKILSQHLHTKAFLEDVTKIPLLSSFYWSVAFAQGDATLAMAVNSTIYVVNDILAFTVSPWFNRGRKHAGLKVIK